MKRRKRLIKISTSSKYLSKSIGYTDTLVLFKAFNNFLPKRYITANEIRAKINNAITLPVITIPYSI